MQRIGKENIDYVRDWMKPLLVDMSQPEALLQAPRDEQPQKFGRQSSQYLVWQQQREQAQRQQQRDHTKSGRQHGEQQDAQGHFDEQNYYAAQQKARGSFGAQEQFPLQHDPRYQAGGQQQSCRQYGGQQHLISQQHVSEQYAGQQQYQHSLLQQYECPTQDEPSSCDERDSTPEMALTGFEGLSDE